MGAWLRLFVAVGGWNCSTCSGSLRLLDKDAGLAQGQRDAGWWYCLYSDIQNSEARDDAHLQSPPCTPGTGVEFKFLSRPLM